VIPRAAVVANVRSLSSSAPGALRPKTCLPFGGKELAGGKAEANSRHGSGGLPEWSAGTIVRWAR